MVEKKCSKCGDRLTGHEDESDHMCRWCVTGWIAVDGDRESEASRKSDVVAQPTVSSIVFSIAFCIFAAIGFMFSIGIVAFFFSAIDR